MNNKFLKWYIIGIILILFVMFLLPDSFFSSKYKNKTIDNSNSPTKEEFTSYEEQIKNLQNNKYSFEYIILDTMGTKPYSYKCTGIINSTLESGNCEGDYVFSYTEENKKEKFKIDVKYLNVSNIFDLLKDIEPKETTYSNEREFSYKALIEDLDTDIVVFTDLKNITRIEINSKYMNYTLKYNKV